MLNCLWNLWDWLDPTSMENKQRSYSNSGNTSVDETLINETVPKHVHQHKTAPQHVRLFQYGLKTSNYQNTQINQPSPHQHQPPLPSHVHQHKHQHRIQSPYQATSTHPHVQHISHQHQPNSPIYQQSHVHQYQQKQNQDHYCYQPTKPVLYLNNLNQNQNVQDWVSRQSPGHYHPQQQYKEKPHNDHSSNNPSLQQPKLKEIDRKKSSGNNNQHLRSPSAKRPLEAPVTLQGWLYKQGSDGLMLWKKRWFVLSEYCLFYYKSQEEEKILGSILLPSYKVSVCGSEDKANKKFAFKCEHANMRTYILAADSQELMAQWVHVLNMACLLQNVNETKTHPSPLSSSHKHTETSNLRHTPSVQIPNLRSNLSHSYMSSNTTDMSSPSQQELSQYSQPLYANAPPKPRRLTDGYISPGLEIFDKHSDESKYVTLQQPHLHNIPHSYVPQTPIKSPINIYENRQAHLKYLRAPVQQQICKKYLHVPEYDIIPVRENHNIERRTPDTYGRSKLNSPKETRSSDYEDIYGDQAMYKRPLSPMMYTSNNRLNPMLSMPVARPPTAIEINGLKNNLPHHQHPQKIPNAVPRPHSADFLEYEVKRHNPNVIARQPRPKSSLDINRHTNSDNYFYTEERYAEKMRNSAQYLPKTPKYSALQDEYLEHQQKWLTKHNKFETDNTFPFVKSNSRAINFTDSNLQNLCKNEPQPVRSHSVLSVNSLSKEVDMDLYDFDKETTPTFHNVHGQPYNYSDDLQKHSRDYDQFTRSASARLAQNNHSETTFLTREGERKREESMKRLLEWKQRMLQSPLNRKVNQSTSKGIPDKFNSYYKSGESACLPILNMDMYLDNTVNSALPHYNSYSSDDEENEDGSKENVQTQAGWTVDTYPSISKSHTPVFTTCTTVFNSLSTANGSICTSSALNEIQHVNVIELPVVCTTSIIDRKVEEEKLEEGECLEKPLKMAIKDPAHTAFVSSLRSEFSNKTENNEVKGNDSSTKSSLSEIKRINLKEDHKESSNFSKDIESVVEENYMPMTPKRSLLNSSNTHYTLSMILNSEVDENPYVEMTQCSEAGTILVPDGNKNIPVSDVSTYEPVYFSNKKMEPLYVELSQLTPDKQSSKVSFGSGGSTSKINLPDILMASQDKMKTTIDNKSDSSDADDEASKDLDSLDTPCHPRFSLSDTFRPASYYLGVSRVVPELQDSSDSELVSPPPISTLPPPLVDLHNADDCISSSQDTSLSDCFKQTNSIELNALVNQDLSLLYCINDDKEQRCSTKSDLEKLNSDSRFKYDSMLKRRPVLDEFYDEFEYSSCSFNNTDNNSINTFDYKSTKINKNSDISSESQHEYENMYIAGEMSKQQESSITMHSHRRDNSKDTVSSQITVNTFKSNSSSQKSTFSSNDFIMRTSSDNATFINTEISGLSTPTFNSTPVPSSTNIIDIRELNSPYLFPENKLKQLSWNLFYNQPAPYYYSDLSINTLETGSNSSILTLNNKRSATSGNKRDIMHIINPIRCNNYPGNSVHIRYQNSSDNSGKFVAEARSVSVDFLNITDKSGNIDKKNIYESDTLKRIKSIGVQSKSEIKNLYLGNSGSKFSKDDSCIEDSVVRRFYSLDGLLENVLNENSFPRSCNTAPTEDVSRNTVIEEKCSTWQESSSNQNHTRSLDDLDFIRKLEKKPKKQSRGISRLVTYVNDNMFNMPIQDKQQMNLENKQDDNTKNENKETGSFIIDREKLRQWDFLSSAPSDTQLPIQGGINSVVDLNAGVSVCEPSEQNNGQNSASGSISVTARDTYPRRVPAKKIWNPNSRQFQIKSTMLPNKNYDSDFTGFHRTQHEYYVARDSSQHDLSSDTSQSSNTRRANWQFGDKMNVSAGELLGRTHEELVLLLIQLRRQSANNYNAIEACYNEIDSIQTKLPKLDNTKKMETLQKLERIKQHLLELEKQYEKGKPLVNLVDNMVKLGSLYRYPKDHNSYPDVKDRLEFNQQMQERRLLAEERRDWNRTNLNQAELQTKVQQLYQLDNLIQEESETLQGLQQDKEEIERALNGLRQRLIKGFKDPAEVEQARKQQIMLENELSRVHSMLAQNSRKLEETIAGNARLEQELLVLKQKLQISKQQRSSPQFSNAGDSLPCVIGTSAMLESDLHRVQQNVGDLQRQRQELSIQVKQLTDRSNIVQQIRSFPSTPTHQTQGNRKKINSLWRETDLDTMAYVDHGEQWDGNNLSNPVYINTNINQTVEQEHTADNFKLDDCVPDNTSYNQNLLPQEKQEIKTVRIVKRESERRQRDREKTVFGIWDAVAEEDDSSQTSSIYFRSIPLQKNQGSMNLETISTNKIESDKYINGILNRQNSLSHPNLPHAYADVRNTPNPNPNTDRNLDNSLELSPTFKSEAAKQIITEISSKQTNRRSTPKEKRRHYTAPHNNLIVKSLNQLPTDAKDFDKLNVRRARDDLDMERALRQRIDAPDVVRSTLSSKEFKYNESTIDNILGTPNKIFIPERYVPEQLPQLSVEEQQHRLRKVESIKKMLSDTTIISGSSNNLALEETNSENSSNDVANKVTSKMIEEKKQRQHLLQLNQILAKQVMEMSKIVAGSNNPGE